MSVMYAQELGAVRAVRALTRLQPFADADVSPDQAGDEGAFAGTCHPHDGQDDVIAPAPWC